MGTRFRTSTHATGSIGILLIALALTTAGACSSEDAASPADDAGKPPSTDSGSTQPEGGDADVAADAGTDADAAPLWGPDADYPYSLSNYDEPYRAQFHFTAPMGWLNDVNGIWYHAGTYHLAYQAHPYAFPGNYPKYWGHATSTDLIHWTHWPIMLDPFMNVPGEAFSGSTVVDTENTSGLQTGTNPVFVALYTATTKGTCIAYSNDLGVTWQAYDKNPVAIGGPDASTRDPHVFWYEPTKSWVTALYESGISIYTSKDLKNWTKKSHVDFGYECPDIYELPVDGNAGDRRWVLQDASGKYLLGTFDGETFTPDGNGPHKMDVGPSFYASQTFYRRTFPDSRVVQMPWVTGMDGVTAPFNQSIGFPAEVKLATLPEGVRVTRTPIAEIGSIYGTAQHVGAQSVAVGQNPLSGVAGRTYDLEVVIDVAGSAATKIDFKLGSKTFTYDVAAQTLLGNALPPVGGKIKVRALVDWAQLELFGNDGRLSYTESYPFSASDTSVAVTGDGAISLVSADFRPVKRVWPGVAASSSAVLDDGANGNTYTGDWAVYTEDRYFGKTCHVSTTAGASIEATFTGTRIDWYGLKNTDLGKADVFIDGQLVTSGIDAFHKTRQNARLFTKGGLTNGQHTIKITVTGQKSAESTGAALVHDYFISYVDP